jgi:hypothetical protein
MHTKCLLGNHLQKIHLGEKQKKQNNNLNMDLGKVGSEDANWIQVAQNGV